MRPRLQDRGRGTGDVQQSLVFRTADAGRYLPNSGWSNDGAAPNSSFV